MVDAAYLKSLGVKVEPDQDTLDALERGSLIFRQRLEIHSLLPRPRFTEVKGDPSSVETQIHNYTGRCPTLTYEINPVRGCGVGCQYCLVSDGVHERELVADLDYHLYVRRLLEEKNGKGSENLNHYYYFSPKTEAFQEATLLTGIAHRILREFIRHYADNPESKARLFIASKAGAKHLLMDDEGETILDLFERLKDRMQFNTSVSIMPVAFRDIIEPYDAPMEERMRAVRLCRERGMGPCLGLVDKDMERQLYEAYLMPSNADHRKQRGRTAPDRALSLGNIRKMMEYTDSLGMSVSICYWVRKQLGISEDMIPLTNRNGFQCLGYQTRLFNK